MSKHNYYTYFEGLNKDGVAVYSGNSSFYTEPPVLMARLLESTPGTCFSLLKKQIPRFYE